MAAFPQLEWQRDDGDDGHARCTSNEGKGFAKGASSKFGT